MTQPVNSDVRRGFSPDRYPWQADLKKALDELKPKIPEIDKYWAYYDGDHPRVWLTDKLRDMFDEQLADNMGENWCDEAVDQPLFRLGVIGWDGETEIHAKAAENIFDENDLDLDQADVYRDMRIAGEAFLFVWRDAEKDTGFDISLNDPRQVWWPANAHRADPHHVVKVWADEDTGLWRATLYYEVDVVRCVGPKFSDKKVLPEVGNFVIDDENPGGEHGFDKVPVIRFATHRKRRSALKGLIPIQDRINKLEANKMVAAEFGAFRALAILTQQEIDEDDLRMRPNRAVVLDPGGGDNGVAPTSIWESTPTELANYDNTIDKEIDKFFTKVPLPRHLRVNPGTPPSGDAIEADEGPFVEMVVDMQKACAASWRDLFGLMGIEVDPQWRNPQVRSDSTEATVVKTFVEAGVPIELALKRYAGWDTEDIKELTERPMTAGEMASALTGLSTGVALGGVDPEQAKAVTAKMLGGKNEADTGSTGTGQPQPPTPPANA